MCGKMAHAMLENVIERFRVGCRIHTQKRPSGLCSKSVVLKLFNICHQVPSLQEHWGGRTLPQNSAIVMLFLYTFEDKVTDVAVDDCTKFLVWCLLRESPIEIPDGLGKPFDKLIDLCNTAKSLVEKKLVPLSKVEQLVKIKENSLVKQIADNSGPVVVEYTRG